MAAMALKAIISIAIALSVSGCFQSMGPLTALNLLMMSMPRPSADAVAVALRSDQPDDERVPRRSVVAQQMFVCLYVWCACVCVCV